MSTPVLPAEYGPPVQPPRVRPIERQRGKWGMWLFIATEGMLFVMLFFAYFYLGSSRPEWPPREDPSIRLALLLLVILLASSAVLHWGERGIKRGHQSRLRVGMGVTLLLGVAFLFVQAIEYREKLEHLTPGTDAYGSIFFTITSFHLAHFILGMCILAQVFARALASHFDAERHLAVGNASLYWHFVDAVWLVVVIVLYLSPRWYA